MKFIDEALIKVEAGHGGKGCISFRREKFVPRGGPDGGNGGKGGDVILKANEGLSTLMDLQYKKHFKAKDGKMGRGKGQDGRGGSDIALDLPVGTMVYDASTNQLLADLTQNNERVVVAKGGRGGKGNAHFTTSTRQAPRFAQEGEEGENKNLRLELKLLADVGLIGLPNAGKSTLLATISKARPKIADYPFTTRTPMLGVVSHRSFPPFTVADIPGLIEGAHEGAGLGIQFLKHVERTRIFLHLISLDPEEPMDILDRFKIIQNELLQYDPHFKKRPQIIVLTKLDLLPPEKDLKSILTLLKRKKILCFVISTVGRIGLSELLNEVAKLCHTDK